MTGLSTAVRHAFSALLAGVALLALAACGDKPAEHSTSLFVFGTKVDITVRGTDEATANKAFAQIGSEFQKMHTAWHAWKPGELTDLNRAIAQGDAFRVSPFLLPLIVEAKRLEKLSGGLFNPAIGAIIGAWGFHSDSKPQGHRPDIPGIRGVAALRPSMADVVIRGDVVSSTKRAVQLDFGGFAKGVALDRAEYVLKSHGIASALINAGGDINTLGSGGKKPWSVGIRDPKAWGVIATIELEPGEDVYTSGNYERFREIDGVRHSHIIDPRTGMPVRHIVSSTVITKNGALADAAATALSVAGPRNWHGVAKRMGIKYAVLVDDQGNMYVNPAMSARVELPYDHELNVIKSPPL